MDYNYSENCDNRLVEFWRNDINQNIGCKFDKGLLKNTAKIYKNT